MYLIFIETAFILSPPKAEATGSTPVGCASFFGIF